MSLEVSRHTATHWCARAIVRFAWVTLNCLHLNGLSLGRRITMDLRYGQPPWIIMSLARVAVVMTPATGFSTMPPRSNFILWTSIGSVVRVPENRMPLEIRKCESWPRIKVAVSMVSENFRACGGWYHRPSKNHCQPGLLSDFETRLQLPVKARLYPPSSLLCPT